MNTEITVSGVFFVGEGPRARKKHLTQDKHSVEHAQFVDQFRLRHAVDSVRRQTSGDGQAGRQATANHSERVLGTVMGNKYLHKSQS